VLNVTEQLLKAVSQLCLSWGCA